MREIPDNITRGLLTGIILDEWLLTDKVIPEVKWKFIDQVDLCKEYRTEIDEWKITLRTYWSAVLGDPDDEHFDGGDVVFDNGIDKFHAEIDEAPWASDGLIMVRADEIVMDFIYFIRNEKIQLAMLGAPNP